MNKILSIAAIVALSTTLSFAQDMSFGVRAALHVSSVTTGDGSEVDEEYGAGIGGAGGLVAVIPISDKLGVRTGAEFAYRTLYNMSTPAGDISANEFALSVPVMVQYLFYEKGWLALGVQADIPFSTEINFDGKSSEFKDRSSVDLGIIIGGGYNITENIVFDIRGTIIGLALTKLSSNSEDKTSLYQGTIGLSYLF